jgi:hypothetical protein
MLFMLDLVNKNYTYQEQAFDTTFAKIDETISSSR